LPVHLRIERGLGRSLGAGLRARLERRTGAMLSLLQLEKAELSLVLSGDEQIRELNKAYRGKDKPTDVLAFAMREGDFGRLHAALPSHLLGDVIVSVPTAERQAEEAGRETLDEVTMLIAHGLLHLLGWDHETPAKDKKMRAETERLVSAAESADVRARRSTRVNTKGAPRTRASGNRKQKPHKRTT
jgi:probable rRNA maturation factor